MKICIFTETYYPIIGGGENQARSLGEALVERGHSVVILTRRTDPSIKSFERFGDISVYRIPPVGDGQLKKWGLIFTSVPALVRLRLHYDLLFVSGFRRVGIAAVLVSKILNKDCVLKADSLGEFSGDYFATGLEKFRLKPSSLFFQPFLWLQRKILGLTDAFVAISSDIADELVAHGVSTENIVSIPNSVDTNRFFPANPEKKYLLRQKLGISQNERVVIFTGRLVAYKGLPFLLRVWKKIQQEYPYVRLLLLGSGGLDIQNCEEDLKNYVVNNKLTDSVQFMGNVDNVYDYLQASDIFVFPTENEAFGIALIEAMACGLPVIATPIGGLKDILEHGKNGLFVQPGEYQDLLQALELLISDITYANALGQSAVKTVISRYRIEAVTDQYVQLFGSLTEKTVMS